MITSRVFPALLMFALIATTILARENNVPNAAKATEKTNAKLDPAASTIKWTGKKVLGEHHGVIKFKSGELTVENGKLIGGSFTVDMTSIRNKDIDDKDTRKKLEGHLRSDDFFSVEKHPTATFTIERASFIDQASWDQPNYRIFGMMEIKGISKKVGFPAHVEIMNGTVHAKAKIELDRTKWDIRYGSGSFFDNVGNTLIDDDFELDIDIKAKI